MTPTDLLLDLPFASLVEGSVTFPSSWSCGVSNASGNVLRTQTLGTKLDWRNLGNAQAPRIATYLRARGLLIEEYRKNYVSGNLAAYTPAPLAALSSSTGPSRNLNEAQTLTAGAAGDTYVQTPLLAGAAGKIVAASFWGRGLDSTVGAAYVQFLAGGAQLGGSVSTIWNAQLSQLTTIPGGATTFQIGFNAGGAGKALAIAYPQVELGSFATSPIVGAERFAEKFVVATPQIVANGRISLNLEIYPTCASTRTDGSGAVEVLPLWYANAANQVFLTTGATPTITITIGGVSEVVSCPAFPAGGPFKLFLAFGGGKTKIAAWGLYTNLVAQCLSSSLTTIRPPIVASSLPLLSSVLSDANNSGKRLCCIVQSVQAFPSNETPPWVACSC